MSGIDLDAYLRRIGFDGAAKADLATLRDVHRLHAAAIPFENLSAFVGEPIALDAAALEAKLVRGGRGGWCFEHNLLLRHVLDAIGFEVATLAARVRWNVPPNVQTARSHCLLKVATGEGDFIADVGFGGQTLTAPLRLAADIVQPTPHESYRLVPSGERFTLETRIDGEWQSLYVFELHEALQADYEVSNWYLAHHPQSQFLSGIIAARAASDRRHALRHTRYAVHHCDGRTERFEVRDASALRGLLAGPFGIRLDGVPGLDARLARLFERD
ncbi:MAG TPA: arylamine N-acetyltransferase [Usitatibacter sp.]|jgi:N-hydroxyarylamine O-acetyltransferase|nr:arylamine N-acetyltransferase [Usitatibacter sp.]